MDTLYVQFESRSEERLLEMVSEFVYNEVLEHKGLHITKFVYTSTDDTGSILYICIIKMEKI
jgi:hypothetical protein